MITDYGKLIQAGTVLVLRRPNVLQMQTNCLVTVTKTCLIGMIPPRSNEVSVHHRNKTKGKVTDVCIHQDYQVS